MQVFTALLFTLVASLCYGQIPNPTTTTLSPGIESEDEPRGPFRAPNVAIRRPILSPQVRQNVPSPQVVRGIPQEETYRPYSFNYVAQGEDGMSSREESADGSGRVVGSYTLAVEDGRRRKVEYVADRDGFRANVETNEDGTDSQNPADVVFYSSVGATPSRAAGNAVALDVPPRPGSRVQGRPSAPLTHYVNSGHYHRHNPQAVHYDDRFGSDYVVFRRPLPYYYGDYQNHYH